MRDRGFVQKVRKVVFEDVPFSMDEILYTAEYLSVNRSRSIKISDGKKNFTITVKRTEDSEAF
jgi:hypothetical protein